MFKVKDEVYKGSEIFVIKRIEGPGAIIERPHTGRQAFSFLEDLRPVRDCDRQRHL